MLLNSTSHGKGCRSGARKGGRLQGGLPLPHFRSPGPPSFSAPPFSTPPPLTCPLPPLQVQYQPACPQPLSSPGPSMRRTAINCTRGTLQGQTWPGERGGGGTQLEGGGGGGDIAYLWNPPGTNLGAAGGRQVVGGRSPLTLSRDLSFPPVPCDPHFPHHLHTSSSPPPPASQDGPPGRLHVLRV